MSIRKNMSTILGAVLVLSGTGVAASTSASAASPGSIQSATHHVLTTAELASTLRSNGASELLDPSGTFDRKAAENRFGPEFADQFQARFQMNDSLRQHGGESHLSLTGPDEFATPLAKDGYVSCVLKGVGLGGLVGTSTAIADAISKKAWQKAAQLIITEAAKRGLKIAIRGGAVGLAGALGGYAIWCATPWS